MLHYRDIRIRRLCCPSFRIAHRKYILYIILEGTIVHKRKLNSLCSHLFCLRLRILFDAVLIKISSLFQFLLIDFGQQHSIPCFIDRVDIRLVNLLQSILYGRVDILVFAACKSSQSRQNTLRHALVAINKFTDKVFVRKKIAHIVRDHLRLYDILVLRLRSALICIRLSCFDKPCFIVPEFCLDSGWRVRVVD